jgi:hypothetical protein
MYDKLQASLLYRPQKKKVAGLHRYRKIDLGYPLKKLKNTATP